MERLKTYFESILDNTSKKVKQVKKAARVGVKEFGQKLKSMRQIHDTIVANDSLYQDILDWFTQIPDDEIKGKRWFCVVPDRTASFKPIMVAYSHGVWRNMVHKDVSGKTESAEQKAAMNYLKLLRDRGVSNCFVPNWFHSGVNKYWVINEYERVHDINGDGWYTIAWCQSIRPEIYSAISINPEKKQWAYGAVPSVPSRYMLDDVVIDKRWLKFSNFIAVDDRYGAKSIKDLGQMKRITKNSYQEVKSVLISAPYSEYLKSKEDWHKFFVTNEDRQSPVSYYHIYVNKYNGKVVLDDEVSKYETVTPEPSKKTVGKSSVQQELNDVKMGRHFGGVSMDTWTYIMTNFKKVDTHDQKGRKWHAVYRSGNDSKYGRIMISVDTQERREQDMMEFYGGGTID